MRSHLRRAVVQPFRRTRYKNQMLSPYLFPNCLKTKLTRSSSRPHRFRKIPHRAQESRRPPSIVLQVQHCHQTSLRRNHRWTDSSQRTLPLMTPNYPVLYQHRPIWMPLLGLLRSEGNVPLRSWVTIQTCLYIVVDKLLLNSLGLVRGAELRSIQPLALFSHLLPSVLYRPT